ncbi:hypothetical protein ACJ72_04274 [Emergomyces africanus]|uniref:Cytochrome c oxidase subunit 13, mitochondrial n=1 Tax=Emergomyces africanus TaxID=1955775 RepID=A0A1B7NX77_9EURO|nr:hypothetical protein ACJ72_04274 [Emergomyces africanus]
MFPRASAFRLAQRAGAPAVRSSPVRSGVLQRRFASTEQKAPALPDNAFNRERAAVKAHAAATSDLWRKLSIYAVVPVVILASINAYNLWNEHWEHWEHMPPLEERVEYPYQNIRNKNYPWGDGDKTVGFVDAGFSPLQSPLNPSTRDLPLSDLVPPSARNGTMRLRIVEVSDVAGHDGISTQL